MSIESDSFDPFVLPGLMPWREAQPRCDALDVIVAEVSISHAALIAKLMRPELIEDGGCVLRRAGYSPEVLREWEAHFGHNVPAIERVLNELHLWDLFHPANEAEYEAVAFIAQVVAESWKATLAKLLPLREFDVSISDDEADYGPTVTFWSKQT